MPGGLPLLLAVEGLDRPRSRATTCSAAKAAGRRPRRGRAGEQDVLHRDLGPRAERARNAGGREDRARDQARSTTWKSAPAWACSRPSRPSGWRRAASTRSITTSTPAPSIYEQICTTHTYQDRVETLKAVRGGGPGSFARGGIIGMGERDEDVVRMALELRELEVESIPLNFLIDIDGTPLARTSRLTPRYCLKALAMFRFVNPASELRIAGGRELHLGIAAGAGPVCRQLDLRRRLSDDEGPARRRPTTG